MSNVVTGLVPVITVMAVLTILRTPLGNYMGRISTTDKHSGTERGSYRAIGMRPEVNQHWTKYIASVFSFSAVSIIFVYLLQQVQWWLSLNHGEGPVSPDQAWNTAVSFTTNTNWQSYPGEEAMTVLTQMAGLAVQNSVSAAVGIAVAVALVRGLTNRYGDGNIGNPWVDLTRIVLRVSLSIAATDVIPLILQGAIQNFSAPQTIRTATGGSQTIPGGVVALQEVIKELGTNDDGHFDASSAHPFENPNAWTNTLKIFLILLIPVPLIKAFGVIIDDKRQGQAIPSITAVLYFISLAVVMSSETALQVFQGGGMKGKEMCFGVLPSSFFAVITIMTSIGVVDSLHSSYPPLAGGMLMLNMLPGEISPGGVGSGLYGTLIIAILTIFIAGLMAGRAPEYLGEHIGVSEITKVCLYILVMSMLALMGVDIFTMLPSTLDSVSAEEPHGFSDLIYAFTSVFNNNGSAFAGFGADTPWFNTSLGPVTPSGRFLPIVMVLGLAGDFAKQRPAVETTGTLPAHRPQFVGLTVVIAITVSVLTFLPAFVPGPLTEALS